MGRLVRAVGEATGVAAAPGARVNHCPTGITKFSTIPIEKKYVIDYKDFIEQERG
jgi:hypothetical protein